MIGFSGVSAIRKRSGVRLATITGVMKYGRATVYNSDGSFNREIPLTPAEYAALGTNARPPGVGAAEKWVAVGRAMDLGDVEERNGSLLILHRRHVAPNGQTHEAYLKLLPGEWTGTAASPTVAASVLDQVPSHLRPLSVLDGIVVS